MFNLDKYEKFTTPYPVLIVDNFFDKNFLENLINEFPKTSQFMNFKKTMVNRRFLSNDNPKFFEYIKDNKFWLKFYETINCNDFYHQVLNLLVTKNENNFKLFDQPYLSDFNRMNLIKFNLSYYFRELTQKIPRNKFFNVSRKIVKKILYNRKKNQDSIYLRFDISSASNGYFRSPHRDSDGTILAFLVYLEDQINIGGKGGDFIINDSQFNIFKSIKPKKNKALFFLSNEKSYHSVSKICNAIGWRKFIYGGFTSTCKNLWL